MHDYLEVHSYRGSFVDGLAALKQRGLELITSEELAEIKTRVVPSTHRIQNEKTWLAESYVYLPNGDVMIVSREHNPILNNVKKAKISDEKNVEFYRDNKIFSSAQADEEERPIGGGAVIISAWKNREFYIDDKTAAELRERAETDLEKAIKNGVLLLSNSSRNKSFPTTAFGEEPETCFLFRKFAKEYGAFLKERGVTDYSIHGTEMYIRRFMKERRTISTDEFLPAITESGRIACRKRHERPYAEALIDDCSSHFIYAIEAPFIRGVHRVTAPPEEMRRPCESSANYHVAYSYPECDCAVDLKAK